MNYETHKLLAKATNLVIHRHPHLLIVHFTCLCLSNYIYVNRMGNRTTITGYVQVTLSPNHYYYPFYSVPFIVVVLCFEMLSNALHCSLMPVFPFVPQNIDLAYFEADGFAVSPLSTCVIDA
jgi:hypothetical protein